ncbi:hypothetical protein K490DRAFT_57631 [Saccharata proteae CBS 121410]|uniref:Uncharacterized protein n=1 Tax=Saccharata proteae CBS 121410 TaxID=1314787 RepID=A0A9P4HW55_9PEZI|nr:hypothetical protein K490DRAFT_57631 [Saccharata proteae CBS 121410]
MLARLLAPNGLPRIDSLPALLALRRLLSALCSDDPLQAASCNALHAIVRHHHIPHVSAQLSAQSNHRPPTLLHLLFLATLAVARTVALAKILPPSTGFRGERRPRPAGPTVVRVRLSRSRATNLARQTETGQETRRDVGRCGGTSAALGPNKLHSSQEKTLMRRPDSSADGQVVDAPAPTNTISVPRQSALAMYELLHLVVWLDRQPILSAYGDDDAEGWRLKVMHAPAPTNTVSVPRQSATAMYELCNSTGAQSDSPKVTPSTNYEKGNQAASDKLPTTNDMWHYFW